MVHRSGFRIRQAELIRFFLSHNNEWITAAVISKQLGITERTVRNHIFALNERISRLNASVASERGVGYKMIAQNCKLIYEELLLNQEGHDSTREDRVHYILIKMLYNDSQIDLGDLEEELLVSRTTLELDLKNIKTMLSKSYPCISLSRRKGRIGLCYTEFSARYLLHQLALVNYKTHNDKICGISNLLIDIDYSVVLKNVIHIIEKSGLYVSDENIVKIASFVSIFKQRIKKGKFITSLEHSCDNVKKNLLDFARELYDSNIKPSVGESHNEELEIKQLSISLSFINLSQRQSDLPSNFDSQPSEHVVTIVQELLRKIKEDHQLDLENDEVLFSSLIWHINALVNRLRHNFTEGQPINDLMKNEYPFMFELSLYLYDLFQTHLQLSPSEGDISYVAAHLAAAVERRGFTYNSSKVCIAFVSHLSNSISSMLMAKLQSEYSAVADFYGPYSSYQLGKCMAQKPDAILTMVPNFSQEVDIPVYIINSIFSKMDKRSLSFFIRDIKQKKHKKNNLSRSVNFINKFRQDFFFPNLALNTSEEVISFMCNVMERALVIPKKFYSLTLEREQITSTLVKNHIAIPHPLQPCANATQIGVATIKKGVPWGDYSAKLIFLLAITPYEKNFLKDFFEFIVNLMENDKAVQQIVTAKNFTFFINQASSMFP
jgi:transcriptional antiterminator